MMSRFFLIILSTVTISSSMKGQFKMYSYTPIDSASAYWMSIDDVYQEKISKHEFVMYNLFSLSSIDTFKVVKRRLYHSNYGEWALLDSAGLNISIGQNLFRLRPIDTLDVNSEKVLVFEFSLPDVPGCHKNYYYFTASDDFIAISTQISQMCIRNDLDSMQRKSLSKSIKRTSS